MGKIACWVVSGCNVTALAGIALLVPADHLAWTRWRVGIIVLLVTALLAIIWQGYLQIVEDRKKEEEQRRVSKQLADIHRRIFANAPSATLETSPVVLIEPQAEILLSDPRVYVEFLDEREGQLYKKTAFKLMNRGGSEACDVRIETIPLRGNSISFPHVAGVIHTGASDRFEPHLEGRWGFSEALPAALIAEWETYKNMTLGQLTFPVKITYQNFSRDLMFEAVFDMVFYPHAAIVKSNVPKPFIEFLNPKFRKVVLVTPQP
jgi:hypothetical protein